ncbi:GIY-YIG nuclease family protein [Candidatus Falkowbacteria bacterium]|nr:GIY-YIG nuclease family protein [Candidatus Falkowbacteria bacterium]
MIENLKHFVYIAKSISNNIETYKGYTVDLDERLIEHNLGLSKHTAKNKPWKIIFYCAFETKEKAISFEKYLKSGSGRAFSSKRFINK